MSSTTVSVAICDDDGLVRRALSSFVTAAPSLRLVGMCGSGPQALDLVERCDPDVLLLDVRMPEMDGYRVAGELLARGARTRVLYLTSFPEPRLMRDAMNGTVAGALTKDLDPETLVRAIHSVADGLTLLSQATTGSPGAAPASDPRSFEALSFVRTSGEAEVLRHLCQGASNSDIARAMNFSESWVKSILRELMKRSGCRNRVELVLAALEVMPSVD